MIRKIEANDLEDVRRWAHDQSYFINFDCFPVMGWIYPDVAAAFLIRTDAKIAFIEHIVKNPQVKDHEGVLKLIRYIEGYAGDEGFKIIFGLTTNAAISKIGRKLEYKEYEYRLLVKEL